MIYKRICPQDTARTTKWNHSWWHAFVSLYKIFWGSIYFIRCIFLFSVLLLNIIITDLYALEMDLQSK